MGGMENNAQDEKDSGGLRKLTREERLEVKLSTYSIEERDIVRNIDRAEEKWRRRVKLARVALVSEKKGQTKTMSRPERSTLESQTALEEGRPTINWRWGICMIAILVLGGLTMINHGKSPNIPPTQHQSVEAARTTVTGDEEATISIEAVGKHHPKPQRSTGKKKGYLATVGRVLANQEKPQGEAPVETTPGPVGTYPQRNKEMSTEPESNLQDPIFTYGLHAASARGPVLKVETHTGTITPPQN
jgi:hypothetical protein